MRFSGPLAFGCVEDWSEAILRALLATASLFEFGQSGGKPPALHRSFLPAILGVLALGILQRLASSAAGQPRFLPNFSAAPWATERAVLHFACLAALLWKGPEAFTRPGSARRFAWALTSVGTLVALIGIIQNATTDHRVYGLWEVRSGRVPFGPYFNHNHATNLMGMSLLTGLGLFASRLAGIWRRLAHGETLSNFAALQVFLLGELGLLAWGIAASVSRGGYLAIALSLLFVVPLAGSFAADPRRRMKYRLAAGALALVFAAGILRDPRWVGVIQGALDRSAASRVSLYQSGLLMFRDFPVFGVGLGAFQEVFAAYQRTEPGFLVDHIHNDWLELLLETGALGFTLYAGGLALFLVKIIGRWKHLSAERFALSAGGLGAAMVFILHGFLDFPFHIPANAVVFFAVLVGVGHVSAPEGHPAEEFPPLPALAQRGRMAQILVGLALGAWALRPAVAAWETRQAQWGDSVARLERAWAWDPVPSRLHSLAVEEFKRSQDRPLAAATHLRRALKHSERNLLNRPLNPDTRNLHAAILTALGRPQDAASLWTQSLK